MPVQGLTVTLKYGERIMPPAASHGRRDARRFRPRSVARRRRSQTAPEEADDEPNDRVGRMRRHFTGHYRRFAMSSIR